MPKPGFLRERAATGLLIEDHRSIAMRCAYGVALGLGAALAHYVIRPLVGDHVPFLFFLPALIWTSVSLGSAPAITVLLIGAANTAVLAHSGGIPALRDSQDIAALGIYLLLGTLLITYGRGLRLTTRRAAVAESRLAIAQDETGVGVFELDFQSRTAYISPSMSRLLRQPISVEPIDLDRWLGRLRPEHVLETQQALRERLARGELRYDREQCIPLPSGEVIWVLNRIQIEATPTGELAHARGAAVDITERKKADDLLQEARVRAAQNEQRFHVALESSVVPFSLLTPVRNADGRIVDFEWRYVNPAAQQALGRDSEALVGRRIRDVMPRAWDVPGQFERYVQCVERGEPGQMEINTGAASRGDRWYHLVISPLQGSIAVWFSNITDRKLHENALEAADQRKDEFLATLAHEIRNPLAAVRQGLSLARATESTELQKRRGHAVIERQVQHLSLLVDDLLDVVRVGRGTLLLRKSQELLSSLVDTAIEAARPQIDAKRHELIVEIPPEPVLIEVDPLRLAQVLSNLLINAAKYTDQGGRIRVRSVLDAQGLVIRIIDNGIGLTPVQQQHIFNMFSQVSLALDRSQNGLGIGLALARGLMELHDGSIGVSSEGPGRGSEFSIRLPAACIITGSGVAQQGASPAQNAHLSSVKRILIADDNRDAADTLAELLRLDGHEVELAYDGEDALTAFMRFMPHIALLDVGMPRLSGLALARKIRQHPAGKTATLIAVTGRGEERERRSILEAGFDHHVIKPTDLVQLALLIGASPSDRAAPDT